MRSALAQQDEARCLGWALALPTGTATARRCSRCHTPLPEGTNLLRFSLQQASVTWTYRTEWGKSSCQNADISPARGETAQSGPRLQRSAAQLHPRFPTPAAGLCNPLLAALSSSPRRFSVSASPHLRARPRPPAKWRRRGPSASAPRCRRGTVTCGAGGREAPRCAALPVPAELLPAPASCSPLPAALMRPESR